MNSLLKFVFLSAVILAANSCGDGSVSLFDGKSLAGWECDPADLASYFKVENGEIVDYEGITINEEGPIGLQLHGNVHMAVKFRNIKIKEAL